MCVHIGTHEDEGLRPMLDIFLYHFPLFKNYFNPVGGVVCAHEYRCPQRPSPQELDLEVVAVN